MVMVVVGVVVVAVGVERVVGVVSRRAREDVTFYTEQI